MPREPICFAPKDISNYRNKIKTDLKDFEKNYELEESEAWKLRLSHMNL